MRADFRSRVKEDQVFVMDEKLRKLQLIQVEILQKIDCVCKKYQINYSLYAGTLLGAVRHQGFIPWDDDLDVCMPRKDYERFLTAWDEEKIEGYILQNKENTPNFTQSFTKIRKDHTAFLQFDWEKGKYHTGIFVDIFPIDRIPDGFFARKLFQWNCLKYQLYTREFVPPKGNAIVRGVSRFFLALVPAEVRPKERERLLKKITRYQNKKLCAIAIETSETVELPFLPDLLDDYVALPFEGETYMCFAKWDEYLSRQYHDYRKLPPEEKRVWTHHPILLDFEHNYEELQ